MKIDEKSQNININQLIVIDWFRLVSIDKFIDCVHQGWILVIPIDMLAKLIITVTSHETSLYSTIATFHQSRLAPHTTPLIYTVTRQTSEYLRSSVFTFTEIKVRPGLPPPFRSYSFGMWFVFSPSLISSIFFSWFILLFIIWTGGQRPLPVTQNCVLYEVMHWNQVTCMHVKFYSSEAAENNWNYEGVRSHVILKK